MYEQISNEAGEAYDKHYKKCISNMNEEEQEFLS